MTEAADAWAVAQTSLSILASVAALIALPYAASQLRQARITSSASAAAMIFSNIKSRTRIEAVAAQTDEKGLYDATCGLLNEIEFSCAPYLDGQFGGNTGKLATEFIKDILASIERHDRLTRCAQRAIHKPDTFECIRQFCGRHKSDWKALKSASLSADSATEKVTTRS